mmetsp:Transcript_81578/g.162329  ORF Transcript_81578/g.162329 Transcript_81578/m.162329 type:complete len:225 (+) Transcript_81578:441-1115(+)
MGGGSAQTTDPSSCSLMAPMGLLPSKCSTAAVNISCRCVRSLLALTTLIHGRHQLRRSLPQSIARYQSSSAPTPAGTAPTLYVMMAAPALSTNTATQALTVLTVAWIALNPPLLRRHPHAAHSSTPRLPPPPSALCLSRSRWTSPRPPSPPARSFSKRQLPPSPSKVPSLVSPPSQSTPSVQVACVGCSRVVAAALEGEALPGGLAGGEGCRQSAAATPPPPAL